MTLREYLKSLADKIRYVCGWGEDELINAQNFVIAIDDVYNAGYEAGQQSGGGSGDSVVWDMITNYGKRTDYTYAFSNWDIVDDSGNVTFEPPVDIVPVNATWMLARIYGGVDLEAQFEKTGKKLDFSKCTNASSTFYSSSFTRIGVCDFSITKNLSGTFNLCRQLVTIDEIKFDENTSYNFTNTFGSCQSLVNVIATGTLSTSGLDLSACPLTRASKLSFLNILVTTSTPKTITFGAGYSLTNEDVAEATNEKGWTVIV